MDFKYKLEKDSTLPLYIQLHNYIRSDILSGRIEDGARLPSRRKLTESLNISKNTVDDAYQKLIDDGCVISMARSGYFARRTSAVNNNIDEPNYYKTDGILYNMSQNGIDSDSLPAEQLGKLYRDIALSEPDIFGFGHKYGEERLRHAISKYLYNELGMSCRSSQVIIGAGVDFIIAQLCCLFDETSVIAFENPCFARSYLPAKHSGLSCCLIDTKLNDFDFEEFKAGGANILYLETAHQFPLGYTISKSTKDKLISWLNEKDGRYIIENDRDSCLWSDRAVEPLYEADTSGRVIYVGSFSSTISPAVKTAYMVLPDEVKQRLNMNLPYYTCLASRLEQRVIAEYIMSGKYEKHLAKLRKIYATKRNILVDEVKNYLPNKAKLFGSRIGTYLTAVVDSELNEAQLRERAADAGVKFISIADCCITENVKLPKNAFVFGFGGLNETEISDAIKRIAAVWN